MIRDVQLSLKSSHESNSTKIPLSWRHFMSMASTNIFYHLVSRIVFGSSRKRCHEFFFRRPITLMKIYFHDRVKTTTKSHASCHEKTAEPKGRFHFHECSPPHKNSVISMRASSTTKIMSFSWVHDTRKIHTKHLISFHHTSLKIYDDPTYQSSTHPFIHIYVITVDVNVWISLSYTSP